MVTLSEDRTAAGMAESLEEPRREEEGDNINAVRFRSGSDDIRTQSSLDRQGVATSHDKEGVDDDESDDQGGDTLGPLMGDDDVELGMDRPPSQPASTQSKNERTSHVHDLSSGKAGGARTHQAVVRSENNCEPKNPGARRSSLLSQYVEGAKEGLGGIRRRVAKEEENYGEDEEGGGLRTAMHGRLQVFSRNFKKTDDLEERDEDIEPVQYRLQAVRHHVKGPKLLRWLGVADGRFNIYDDYGANPDSFSLNNLVMRYLHWTFRSSFTSVFLSAAVGFISLTMMFAAWIWALGRKEPGCIGGVDFETDTSYVDAFILSWTTFSTVGFGVIFAGTSSEVPNVKNCTGITIVVTLEAFVGVLFSGMSGAIMFAKVARIQSFAQVIFSDPIVIRYGSGVANHDSQLDDDSDEGVGEANALQDIPCPVLEFRLLNRLNATIGGEILDASVTIVASIDATQACPTVRQATRRRRGKKNKKRTVGSRSAPNQRASILGSNRGRNGENGFRSDVQSLASNVSLRTLGKTHQAFEEDPTGHLVPKRIFSKLEIESPEHPFFKRVWMVRHRLDESSPLLKAHARQLVQENHGHWPIEMNSAEGVRAAVNFDQILVSMSGTSNADANSVYAQKVYDFVDVNVGYRFVNVLYRDTFDGSLFVDSRLVNDVTEQAGGGGESFNAARGETLGDMLVL